MEPNTPTKRNFVADRRANMALFATGLLLAAVFIGGGVVDYVSLVLQKSDVQAAADNAALGAVREVQIAQNDPARLNEVAKLIAEGNLAGYENIEVVSKPLGDGILEVFISVPPRVFFPGIIGSTATAVQAVAVAQISGAPVCMIGLDVKAKRTLDMQKSARITAVGCAIYSNSKSNESITISDTAEVNAEFICSAGGVKTSTKLALDPAPLTDCPPISDPLENRPEPSVGACTYTKKKVEKGQVVTLSPGVYCGGLEVKGSVRLSSGVYILKDGPLAVKDGGKLDGDHVGFFLTGKDALIEFEKESSISLVAPKTGPLAGLLFFEGHNVTAADAAGGAEIDPVTKLEKPKEHRIRSDDASTLVGTIYIPRNKLLIDGDKPIAAESEYTVIIAREFALAEGPEIILNTDYNLSDVPLPTGVGNQSKKSTKLVR